MIEKSRMPYREPRSILPPPHFETASAAATILPSWTTICHIFLSELTMDSYISRP